MLTIAEIEKLPIVFIIGRGRSGTSLLQTIFDANPSVITANESIFILHLKQKYSKINHWSEDNINEFISDIYKDLKFLHLWNISPIRLKEKINLYSANELNFSILCKIVYLSITSPFTKDQITLIVDKNPMYSFFIEDLIALFPNAKFIHIIRDYRDNVISNRKAFNIKNVVILSQRWKRQNMYIDKLKLKYKDNFHTVQYETLVNDSVVSVQNVCDFTSILFTPLMLEFHETTNKVYNSNSSENTVMNTIVKKIHSNLLNPINSNQIAKWKIELTNNEIELIDYIAGDYAKKHGYLPTTNVTKPYFFISSIKSYFTYRISYFIYKMYYRLPMSMRDLSGAFSILLYKTFGYLNKYNKIGILYQKNNLPNLKKQNEL